jgi:zinc protease
LLQEGGLADLKAEDRGRVFVGHRVDMMADSEDDAFTIASTTSTADLDLELQFLTAKFTEPGWRSDGWKAVLATVDQMQRASGATAGGVFDQNFRALLHPGDERWIMDTPEMRASFTPSGARAFIEPILRDADIEVLMVGDVAPDQAIAAVAKTFGALPRRKGMTEPAGTRVEHFPAPAAEPVVLHHPGRADQAIAEISWPTTDEHAAWADIAPTVILAEILRQRVIDRLRTAEGETYTPRGGAEFSRVFPGWGRISLLVPCKPEDIPKVYAEIDSIAADLASQPATDDELQRAIRPEVLGATRSQQQIGYWVTQLAGAQTNPDRLEYIRQTLPRLSAVTAADVRRVAKRWLRADRAFRIEVIPSPGSAAASVAAR